MKKSFILVVFLVVFSFVVGCSSKEINKILGNWDANHGFTYTLTKESDNTYSYTIKDNLGSTKVTGGVYDEKTKTLVFSGNEVEAQDCKFQHDAAKDELIEIDTDGTKRQLKRLGE